jgi:hypothetical protein
MIRGEGGSDEATFLGFVWMENLRTWSGLIVHLYFSAQPLKVRLTFTIMHMSRTKLVYRALNYLSKTRACLT